MGLIGIRTFGPSAWLTMTIDTIWMAVYRVEFQGEGPRRRARILELRIVPCAAFGFDPRHDFDDMRKRNRLPIASFSFEAVRRKVTKRLFHDALVVAAQIPLEPDVEGFDGPWANPATELEPPPRARRGPGRPPVRDLAFYAKFTVQYERVEHSDRRDKTSTREILAAKHHVPVTTIGKWIRVARQKGLLTPVVRGQRGGFATERAYQLTKAKATK
jgi:hypothetical protein